MQDHTNKQIEENNLKTPSSITFECISESFEELLQSAEGSFLGSISNSSKFILVNIVKSHSKRHTIHSRIVAEKEKYQ